MKWELLLPKLMPLLCWLFRLLRRNRAPRGTVLIVEDNKYDAELLEAKLIKAGFKTEIATSGEAAEGMVRHKFYPVILMDMRLPRMSGEALLRVLSEKSPNSNIVIVCGEPSDLASIPPGSFFTFIGKPASADAIVQLTRKLYIHEHNKPTK